MCCLVHNNENNTLRVLQHVIISKEKPRHHDEHRGLAVPLLDHARDVLGPSKSEQHAHIARVSESVRNVWILGLGLVATGGRERNTSPACTAGRLRAMRKSRSHLRLSWGRACRHPGLKYRLRVRLSHVFDADRCVKSIASDAVIPYRRRLSTVVCVGLLPSCTMRSVRESGMRRRNCGRSPNRTIINLTF